MSDEGRKIFDELEAIARKNTGNCLPTREDLINRMESGDLFPFYSITEERTMTESLCPETLKNIIVYTKKYRAQGWYEDVDSCYSLEAGRVMDSDNSVIVEFEGGYIVASRGVV